LFVILLAAGAIVVEADVIGGIALFLFFGVMLVLAFGTFRRTHLTRNNRDQPVIKLTRWFCFFPIDKKTLNPRRFDRIKLEHTGEGAETMVLIFLLLFCLCGMVPALVYALAFSGRYHVELLAEGAEPKIVYRGWSQTRMRAIADAIEEATGLGY
jgi:hypothetical protein